MSLFGRIFRRKAKQTLPPMPSRDEIVEMMQDRGLDAFSKEVVDVLYSKDRSMRYVILKGDNRLLTYQLQTIYQYDAEEWNRFFSDSDAPPAIWEPCAGTIGMSVFENVEELRKELKTEVAYKLYFE